MAEVDWNKIIAQVFVDLTTSTVRGASAKVSDTLRKLISALQKDFEPYLISTLKKCSSVRTLLHRDEAIPLSNIYVTTYLKSSNQKFDDIEFVDAVPSIKYGLITGTAGSGKSIFLKYLFLSLFERRRGKIPFFVELRHMNTLKSRDLKSFIYHTIVGPGGKVTLSQFESGLKAGLFTFVLDGFDEIDFDWRADLEKQIFELQENYPDNGLLISSRPDERFTGWHAFKVYNVQPMAKKEVLALLRKIEYEKDVKQKFIKTLKSGLFERHSSFLSTPLLATMMLLTFDQFATIPDKIHVFYDQCFDALFSKHDASKQGGYKRRIRTDLSVDDFKRCLSSFCAVTYAKGKAVFSETEARTFLSQALSFEKLQVKADDLIYDLVESVCVLQRDGLFFTFSHRSFQEYFTAYFICRSPAVNLATVLDQLAMKTSDSVLRMSFDMNQNLLEREWILPKLIELNRVTANIPIEDFYDFMNLLYIKPQFMWSPEGLVIRLSEFTDWGRFRVFLYWSYTAEFEGTSTRKTRSKKENYFKMIATLKAAGDGRAMDKNGRPKAGFAGIEIQKSDNETLADSWLARNAREEREVLKKIEAQVTSSVAEQNDILKTMFETKLSRVAH